MTDIRSRPSVLDFRSDVQRALQDSGVHPEMDFEWTTLDSKGAGNVSSYLRKAGYTREKTGMTTKQLLDVITAANPTLNYNRMGGTQQFLVPSLATLQRLNAPVGTGDASETTDGVDTEARPGRGTSEALSGRIEALDVPTRTTPSALGQSVREATYGHPMLTNVEDGEWKGWIQNGTRMATTVGTLLGVDTAKVASASGEEMQSYLTRIGEMYGSDNLKKAVETHQRQRVPYGYPADQIDGKVGRMTRRADELAFNLVDAALNENRELAEDILGFEAPDGDAPALRAAVAANLPRVTQALVAEAQRQNEEAGDELPSHGTGAAAAESLDGFVKGLQEGLGVDATGRLDMATLSAMREAQSPAEYAENSGPDVHVGAADGTPDRVTPSRLEAPAVADSETLPYPVNVPAREYTSLMNAAMASVIATSLQGDRLDEQIRTIGAANADRLFGQYRNEPGVTRENLREHIVGQLHDSFGLKKDWNAVQAGEQSYASRAEAKGRAEYTPDRVFSMMADAIVDRVYAEPAAETARAQPPADAEAREPTLIERAVAAATEPEDQEATRAAIDTWLAQNPGRAARRAFAKELDGALPTPEADLLHVLSGPAASELARSLITQPRPQGDGLAHFASPTDLNGPLERLTVVSVLKNSPAYWAEHAQESPEIDYLFNFQGKRSPVLAGQLLSASVLQNEGVDVEGLARGIAASVQRGDQERMLELLDSFSDSGRSHGELTRSLLDAVYRDLNARSVARARQWQEATSQLRSSLQ